MAVELDMYMGRNWNIVCVLDDAGSLTMVQRGVRCRVDVAPHHRECACTAPCLPWAEYTSSASRQRSGAQQFGLFVSSASVRSCTVCRMCICQRSNAHRDAATGPVASSHLTIETITRTCK